jgi:hypothetical protein
VLCAPENVAGPRAPPFEASLTRLCAPENVAGLGPRRSRRA